MSTYGGKDAIIAESIPQNGAGRIKCHHRFVKIALANTTRNTTAIPEYLGGSIL